MSALRDVARVASIPAIPIRGLSRDQAASYVGVSPSSFDKMVDEKSMPEPKVWRARKLWDVRALDRAFDALPGGDQSGDEDNRWDDIRT